MMAAAWMGCTSEPVDPADASDEQWPSMELNNDLQDLPAAAGVVGVVDEVTGITRDVREAWGHVLHLYGKSLGGVTVSVGALAVGNGTEDVATVEVESSIAAFARPLEVALNVDPGGVRTLPMEPTLDPSAWYDLDGTELTALEYFVRSSGEVVAAGVRAIDVVPVDQVRWRSDVDDFRPFVATLVTPDVQAVDELMRDAMRAEAMLGLRSGEDAVHKQVEAMFNALAARGATYTQLPSGYYDAPARVDLPSRSLASPSGNCMDGTLLLASVIEAADIPVDLVFTSDHALVGYRTTEGGSTFWPIETTVMGRGTFDDARRAGTERVVSAAASDPEYLLLSLPTLREIGIEPVPLE